MRAGSAGCTSVPARPSDVAATAAALHGDVAWVRTKEQMIDDGWLGGVPSPDVAARLGDVALVPFAPTAFLDPADTGELRLKARHGSLTPAEMSSPTPGLAGIVNGSPPVATWARHPSATRGRRHGDERRKAPWLTRRTTM